MPFYNSDLIHGQCFVLDANTVPPYFKNNRSLETRKSTLENLYNILEVLFTSFQVVLINDSSFYLRKAIFDGQTHGGVLACINHWYLKLFHMLLHLLGFMV